MPVERLAPVGWLPPYIGDKEIVVLARELCRIVQMAEDWENASDEGCFPGIPRGFFPGSPDSLA
jgi:hypothetical protein